MNGGRRFRPPSWHHLLSTTPPLSAAWTRAFTRETAAVLRVIYFVAIMQNVSCCLLLTVCARLHPYAILCLLSSIMRQLFHQRNIILRNSVLAGEEGGQDCHILCLCTFPPCPPPPPPTHCMPLRLPTCLTWQPCREVWADFGRGHCGCATEPASTLTPGFSSFSRLACGGHLSTSLFRAASFLPQRCCASRPQPPAATFAQSAWMDGRRASGARLLGAGCLMAGRGADKPVPHGGLHSCTSCVASGRLWRWAEQLSAFIDGR